MLKLWEATACDGQKRTGQNRPTEACSSPGRKWVLPPLWAPRFTGWTRGGPWAGARLRKQLQALCPWVCHRATKPMSCPVLLECALSPGVTSQLLLCPSELARSKAPAPSFHFLTYDSNFHLWPQLSPTYLSDAHIKGQQGTWSEKEITFQIDIQLCHAFGEELASFLNS